MTGWGLIGASNIARQYMISAIRAQPDNEIVGVFSSNQDRANSFTSTTGIDNAYSSIDALLANPAINCVYISTTNELHQEQAIAASNAGKHVLCEKPLALNVAGARSMLAAAHENAITFATNHHLRNAGLHRHIREMVGNGDLGEILAVRIFHAVFLPPFLQGWRIDKPDAGGGVVLDITVHDADTVRFVLDDDPLEVTAMTATQGMGVNGLHDAVMGVMRMKSGTLVQFHDAFTIANVETGFEVIGSRAALIGRNCMTQNPIGDLFLRRGTEESIITDLDRNDLYTRSVANFVAAVNGTGAPSATGTDGLWSLATALAVQKSASTGHSITVSID